MFGRDDYRSVEDVCLNYGGSVLALNASLTPEKFSDTLFSIYLINQKPGDLVLLPSDAIHQVTNHGGLSVKIAWNRTTLDTIERFLVYHELYHQLYSSNIFLN